jgi:hypothetical protein
VPTWTAQDRSKSLKIRAAVASRVIPFLQVQGYVEPAGRAEWLTTVSGEAVSGSKSPRFTPETVTTALSALAKRIKAVNQDPEAGFHVVNAVAFGDFLRGRARAQAADVGIQLVTQKTEAGEVRSAVEQSAQREFLRQLKGTGSVLSIRSYEEWMNSRSHHKLL